MNTTQSPETKEKSTKTRVFRWVSVVALSALVSSGATFAMISMIQHPQALLGPASENQSGIPAATAASVSVNVSDGITQVVKKVEPDVVAVVNYTTATNFFGQQSQQTQPQESDIGSGVLFDKDAKYGYIVTNNHVVAGGSKVEIVLQSGKHVVAQVVGTDPYTDLAVVKVPVHYFSQTQPIQFADSSTIQVGEPAIAIGTPMGLDFADSVTSGIVSGKQRMMPVEEPTSQQALDYQAVIQTDAAINPGNSGGPLLNISGQVMGINSSKIVQQNFEGMGFAIPANEVQKIASEILKTGHAVHPALGIDGYSLADVPQQYWPNVPVNYGVFVQGLTSAAARTAGLKQGDVIVGLNGHTINTIADLRTNLFQLTPGQQVTLNVYRGSQKLALKVTLGQENSINTTTNVGASNSTTNGTNGGGLIPSSQNPFGQ